MTLPAPRSSAVCQKFARNLPRLAERHGAAGDGDQRPEPQLKLSVPAVESSEFGFELGGAHPTTLLRRPCIALALLRPLSLATLRTLSPECADDVGGAR
jgi:hypothetical protein